ncbi:hypothetical protein CPU12_00885 [Malaciobacter molluscorum LMG 25693]|nr:hypothetical protein CPU12_00885 [Malaciobacter molluscorum LMG 25693]
MIEFRDAITEQSQLLSDIAIESKGYWGYSREQLDIWRKDLRIEKEYIENNLIKIVYQNSNPVGFFSIKSGTLKKELDHLWLLPEIIGKGVGNIVFDKIINECKRLNISKFTIVSDPDAEGFYLHKGAKRIGEVESISQKRMLPLLEYQVGAYFKNRMIPYGYMYKMVSLRPNWLNAPHVMDIFSVSSCVSKDFDDWISYWKHNDYGFFDSPEIIKNIARDNSLDLGSMKLFFYESYEKEWNDKSNSWVEFLSDSSVISNIELPLSITSQGFDIVSYTNGAWAECSLLSCNHMAEQIDTNEHCLLNSLKCAIDLIEQGIFKSCEPGPYRIIEVFVVEKS